MMLIINIYPLLIYTKQLYKARMRNEKYYKRRN